MVEADNYPRPSQMDALFLNGLEDVIGKQAIAEFSNLVKARNSPAGTDTRSAEIQHALEVVYGNLGGLGIAYRTGRASSSRLFRKFGQQMGLNDQGFRLLSTQTRIKTGLSALAHTMSRLCGQPFWATEDNDAWVVQAQTCQFCMHRMSEKPVCYFLVGLLQEFVATISGGRIYDILETECRAAGANACVFKISKQALE